MRKYLRSLARHNMKLAGVPRKNKKRYTINNGMLVRQPSFFAANWKNWL